MGGIKKMLKLKVRIWIETGCNEPEEANGYIEGYSGDRVLHTKRY